MRRLAAALLVVVLLGAGAACGRKSPGPDGARISVAPDGAAHVVGVPGSELTGGESGVLRPGDVVSVDRGSVLLDFRGDARLELVSGSELEVSPRPELVRGDALVMSGDDPFVVRAAGSDVEVSGTGRVTRGLGVTAGSYRGKLVVRSAGRSLTVPALRRTTVPGLGLVPGRPAPLSPQADDAWDVRFIGRQIMRLSTDLSSRSNGFTKNVESAGLDASIVSELVPGGESLVPRAGRRPAGELLVGVALAAAVERGDAADRLARIFRFRDERAPWGLVVLDQALADPDRAKAIVEAATRQLLRRRQTDGILLQTSLAFAQAAASSAGGGAVSAGTGDVAAPAGGGAGGAAGGGGGSGVQNPPGGPPPDGPLVDVDVPDVVAPVVGPAIEPVGDAVGETVGSTVNAVVGVITTTTTLPPLPRL